MILKIENVWPQAYARIGYQFPDRVRLPVSPAARGSSKTNPSVVLNVLQFLIRTLNFLYIGVWSAGISRKHPLLVRKKRNYVFPLALLHISRVLRGTRKKQREFEYEMDGRGDEGRRAVLRNLGRR